MQLAPVPNYWTSTRTTTQKKQFFWSNPYKLEVVITSLIKMLEWPNFGHMNKSTILIESRDEIILVTSRTGVMTPWPLFQNAVILRTPGVAIFVDTIKIITRFIKKIFKVSEKVKRIRNYVSIYKSAIYVCISWYNKICWFLVKKCWCQQNSGAVSGDLSIFDSTLGKV